MKLTDLIFTTLILLLGEEGTDYIYHSRDIEEWRLIGWIHRN